MAIVPQVAFPIVNASAGVYDRSIDRCRRGAFIGERIVPCRAASLQGRTTRGLHRNVPEIFTYDFRAAKSIDVDRQRSGRSGTSNTLTSAALRGIRLAVTHNT